MWWVSSSWCYTTLHYYLSRMKPLCWHIGLVHSLNVVLVEMQGIYKSFHVIWMNVVLAKNSCMIIYLEEKEFFIMNIPYEMFLTIQLMHFTFRKDHIKSPTSKEGWDLFRRTSDDISRWRIIWWMQRHHWCRTFQLWRRSQEEREGEYRFKKNDY